MQLDYAQPPSFADAAQESDVAVVGRVQGYGPGPVATHSRADDAGEREQQVLAVMRVTVERVLKGRPPSSEGVVRVALVRGGRMVDEQGKTSGRGAVTPFDALRSAVPPGTRLLAVADPLQQPVPVVSMEWQDPSAVTTPTRALSGMQSLGFFFEDPETGEAVTSAAYPPRFSYPEELLGQSGRVGFDSLVEHVASGMGGESASSE